MPPLLGCAAAILLVANLACATSSPTGSGALPKPPAASAALAERQAYYQAHRPLAVARTSLTLVDHGVAAPEPFFRSQTLELADGTRLGRVSDLLVAVDARSATAAAASKALGADSFWATANWVGIACMAGGVCGGATLFLAVGGLPGLIAAAAVGGAGVLGGVTASGMAFLANKEASSARERAFRCYDVDLRRALDLVEASWGEVEPANVYELAACAPP